MRLEPQVEGEWSGAYDFVQLADPQLGMLHGDADWTEELTMLRLAVQHTNRLRPRFLLISGDLINAFPSADADGGPVAARQVASFKEALHELSPSIPVVLLPGNHDIGQKPCAADVDRYRARFGDDYFSFWVGGVMYVALNSQYYRDSTDVPALREAQDEWARGAFAEAIEHDAHHVVLLSHVPPFISDEDEQAGWANWQHEHRQRLLAMATQARVKIILCGHYHGNAVCHSKSGIEVVTSSSCGGVINWTLDPSMIATQPFPDFKKVVGSPPVVADARHSGMRIVRVGDSKITHRWFELANVPPTLDEAFASKRRPERSKELADVMGLSAYKPMMRRESSMNVVLPKRAQSICSPHEAAAIREAREQGKLREVAQLAERRMAEQRAGSSSPASTASSSSPDPSPPRVERCGMRNGSRNGAPTLPKSASMPDTAAAKSEAAAVSEPLAPGVAAGLGNSPSSLDQLMEEEEAWEDAEEGEA